MLGQTFSKCFLVLGYQWNKNYIATHLCENRDKPEMKCAGKCYLCKRMKKEDKNDQENPERRSENKFELITFLASYRLTHPIKYLVEAKYPTYQENIYNCFFPSLFHPPQV
jgi:hypothetical protein